MRSDAHLFGRSILGWLAELALISAGVFLALLADQWREGREHQQLAARKEQGTTHRGPPGMTIAGLTRD